MSDSARTVQTNLSEIGGIRLARTMTVAVLATLIVAGAVAGDRFFLEPGPPLNPPRIVTVKHGESFRSIAGSLQRAGVIRNALALYIYARLAGQANRMQPGEYRFVGGETIAQVLGHIVRGESLEITITVPEGSTVRQIAERVELAGLACDWKFERAARNSGLPKALGLTPLGVEGYLFPATYKFAPSASVEQILTAMLQQFFAKMTAQVQQRTFELGLTTTELVTMASIIEKEAKIPSERPLIAGVFYNRLRLHMPLQSDPTAQYSFDGTPAPAAQAVHTSSPFNTYDFAGLPPGPIANPGWSSIVAALYPVPTEYLYFVARKDGTHVFSRTLQEHDRAIQSLRKASLISAPSAMNVMASHSPVKQDPNLWPTR